MNRLLKALIALCATLTFVSSQRCGGAGFDLSSLAGHDYSFDVFTYGANNWTYYVNPCAPIASSIAPSQCQGSMFCQVARNSGTTNHSLAVYNTSAESWMMLPNVGVQLAIQDGEYCSTIKANREVEMLFVCNAAATTAYLSSVIERETCHYQAVFQTSLACGDHSYTGIHQPGDRFISSTCGAGIYDLSSLSGRDLVFDGAPATPNSGWLYFLRLCGEISSPNATKCLNAGPSMACQQSKATTSTSVYQLAIYNSTTTDIYQLNADGMSLTIQDGTYCATIKNFREVIVHMICNRTVTTPVILSVAEVEVCYYEYLVHTNAVCDRSDVVTSSTGAPLPGASSTGPSTPSTCGGAGMDLSSLAGHDYSFDVFKYGANNWTYYVNPCAPLSPSIAPTQCGSIASLFCQVARNSGTTNHSLANYDTAQMHWLVLPNVGIQVSIQDGEYCASIKANREVEILFVCNSAATTAYLSSVSERETCHYQAVFQTSLACGDHSYTGIHQPGDQFISSTCGAGVFDLSSISNRDLVFDGAPTTPDAGWLYFLRLCGEISTPTANKCLATGPSMACQQSKSINSTSVYPLAIYNSTTTDIYQLNADGMSLTVQDGAYCGTTKAARVVIIHMICDRTATTPVILSVAEIEVCYYEYLMHTNAVCDRIDGGSLPSTSTPVVVSSSSRALVSSTGPAIPSTCGGAGMDLSSLTGHDYSFDMFKYGANNWTYYVNPCAPLSSSIAPSQCGSVGAMFCQVARNSGTTNHSLANYDTAQMHWLVLPNVGIQVSIQDGEYCSTIKANREVEILFVCNSAATTAYLSSVSERETCHYQAVFQTSLACGDHSYTGIHQPGDQFISSTCGAGVFDLSSISNRDLVFDGAPTTPDAGWLYFLRLCGEISTPTANKCLATGPSMACQQSKSINSTSVYPLAIYNSTTTDIYQLNADGMSLTIQDGAYCGTTKAARVVIIHMICDRTATTPVILSVAEIEVCYYEYLMHTNAVCDRVDGQIAKPTSSSSSSLSSGGIAGIVIGVFVAVVILLGVIFASGICGRQVGKKTQKFDELADPESSAHDASSEQVEMA